MKIIKEDPHKAMLWDGTEITYHGPFQKGGPKRPDPFHAPPKGHEVTFRYNKRKHLDKFWSHRHW